MNDEGRVHADPPLAFTEGGGGLFPLLPVPGKRRFDLPLLPTALFGRGGFALPDQFFDVAFELLLARFAGGVFVLFHGFGNFMVSTPAAANSAPQSSPDRAGLPEKRSPRPPGRILADLPVHPLHDRLADRQPQADAQRKGKKHFIRKFRYLYAILTQPPKT